MCTFYVYERIGQMTQKAKDAECLEERVKKTRTCDQSRGKNIEKVVHLHLSGQNVENNDDQKKEKSYNEILSLVLYQ